MDLIFYIVVALLSLSVLVFFHELGHYSAAKFFGVKVERFSIGFGKVLFKKEWLDTEWAFAPILLGGYVKMKGQDDANPLNRNSDPDSYTSKKPWQRVIILLAGPLANIILAFFIYLTIALNGAPVSTAVNYVSPIIGKVMPNTPALKAGLQSGDKIISIGDSKIKYWYEIKDAIESNKPPFNIKISRANSVIDVSLNPLCKPAFSAGVFGITFPIIGET